MKMYEARNKKTFIETINNKDWYEWLFDKTFEYEHRFSKDLFDFNKEELLEFLSKRNLSFSTLNVAKGYISMYINWAIDKGYRLNKKNITNEISPKELKDISKEVDVLHVDYIYSMIGRKGSKYPTIELRNHQDKLMIYLLFIGIRGERAKELVNLKYEHADLDNRILKLSEVNPERNDIKLDEIAYNLFLEAKDEKIYTRYLDESNMDRTNIREDYELVDSDYVFKKSLGGRHNGANLTYQGILRRLKSFSAHTGFNLTMKNIEKAGMTYIGSLIVDEGMELTVDNPVVVDAIFNRYGIKEEQARWKVLRQLRKDITKTYHNYT